VRPRLEFLEDRAVPAGAFVQTNLVSDLPGVAQITDPNLKNPWGVAVNPAGDFSVSDEANGTATLYKGDVNGQAISLDTPVIKIPGAAGNPTGKPTGQVFNSTPDFGIAGSGRAEFIFAGLDGTISAVAAGSSQAQLMAASTGAVYTGLALGSIGSNNFLYAANGAGAGSITVYNLFFQVVGVPGTFTDPSLPSGLVPFNVANINGTLFVTYDNPNNEQLAGVVDKFNTQGTFLGRFAGGSNLVAPWAVVQAPGGFDPFGGDILVGDFGDGHINVFDPNTGQFLGQLNGADGQPLAITHLYGLTFGNGSSAGSASTLYFAAGLNQGRDGVFGSLKPVQVNPAFVTQVYTDLLQRPVDAAGLAFWDNQQAQGASRQQVVAAIENTPEFQAVQVRNLYTRYLHRAVDPVGLNFWTAQLAQGATLEQVESGITGSPEFFTTQGGGTKAGFLTALYHDALGRAPDATGETGFMAALNSGATTAQVAAVLFASNEFRTDLVSGFYQSFLHRAADANGLQFFVQALQQGATDQDVIAVIVGSNEYFSRL
jgi:uncharacterized protein (TIGR03118 family)